MTATIETTELLVEQGSRAHSIADGLHSLEMEGLHITPETTKDAAEYVACEIDVDEFMTRILARYDLV